MTSFTKYLAGVAAIGGLSAPVAAQSTYGYQQQTYPQQSSPNYRQQGYPGYTPGYGQQGYAQNPVGQVIDQLLGNRYNVTDRQAVARCASAAVSQASAQYDGAYGQQYDQRYGQQYGQGYNRYAALRVTAITDVQRRQNGLRVSGLMSSRSGHHDNRNGQYANGNGYQNREYARGDVSFRCNVDYRGQVTNVRINRNDGYGR